MSLCSTANLTGLKACVCAPTFGAFFVRWMWPNWWIAHSSTAQHLHNNLPESVVDLWMSALMRVEARDISETPDQPTCYPFRKSKWIIFGGNLKLAKTSIVCIKNRSSKHAKLRWQAHDGQGFFRRHLINQWKRVANDQLILDKC